MLAEKLFLPLEQYPYIIQCLENEVEVENCLRVLCQYDMDLSLEDTWIITSLVTSLMMNERYGDIAEWLVRQWNIASDEGPMEPRKIHVSRDWIKEGSRFKGKKTKIFGLIFRKKQFQKKIRNNRSLYRKEKDLESIAEVETKAAATEYSSFKVPTLLNFVLLRRGQKRKHQQTIID